MNTLEKYQQKNVAKQLADRAVPDFKSGDVVRVMVKIAEGTTERVQAFEGLVLRRKSRGLGSTFMVKKESHGESVERVFHTYSPRIAEIKVIRRGRVRRAKLYYMRGLTGKAARITEKVDFNRLAEAKAKVKATA